MAGYSVPCMNQRGTAHWMFTKYVFDGRLYIEFISDLG
jgi:hypothetical protein